MGLLQVGCHTMFLFLSFYDTVSLCPRYVSRYGEVMFRIKFRRSSDSVQLKECCCIMKSSELPMD